MRCIESVAALSTVPGARTHRCDVQSDWCRRCITIKVGSKGAAVKLAQARLNARHYTAGTADGIFGNVTRNAVKSYQTDRAHDTVVPLQSDGVVGPKTWARLDPPTIKKGADGAAVKLLQERLNVFSFLFTELDVDGDSAPARRRR